MSNNRNHEKSGLNKGFMTAGIIIGVLVIVTVPNAFPMAMAQNGNVTTATDCKIINNSFGAVRVASVSISAANGWKLTSFGDKSILANEKVDSDKFGFALIIGGGRQVTTDTSNAAIAVEPGKKPYVQSIPNTLESLQHEVGGDLQAITPYADQVAIVAADEGKLMGLPFNRAVRDEDGKICDYLVGKFLIVGVGEEKFTSISNEPHHEI